MKTNCSFVSSSLLKDLEIFCGNDSAKYLEYFSKIFKSNPEEEQLEFRPAFTKWYKKKYKEELDTENLTSEKLKTLTVDYATDLKPSYEQTEESINTSRAVTFGYTSSIARKKAIFYISVLIYNDYLNADTTKNKKEPNTLSDIASNNVRYIRDNLAYMLAQGDKELYKEIWKNLTNNCSEYLDNLIRENKNNKTAIPYTNTIFNWIALYKELTTTYKETEDSVSVQEKIFDEIYNSKLITSLKLSRYDNFDDIENANKASLDSSETTDSTEDDSVDEENNQTDTSIRDHTLHHGEYNDFKKHLSERIKRILNTIPKLNSPVLDTDDISKENIDLKIDESIGFPEYLDSTEVATALYSYVSKDDADSMVESIKNIAETFPEYAGFSILYNKLKSNQDLKFHFYTNFGKHIISKAQTIFSDDLLVYRISNSNANRLDTLKTQYINEFITNAVNIDITDIKTELDNITFINKRNKKVLLYSEKQDKEIPKILFKIENEVGKSERLNEAIGSMYNILKYFYPSLSHVSLVNFVVNNKDLTIQQAMAALYSDVKKAVNTAESVQLSIKRKEDGIKAAMAYNNKLRLENKNKKANHTQNEFKDIKQLKEEDPIKTEMLSSPISFAEHMLKYTMIKTNLNSVNVHGNQSSDILNSSLITRLKAIFENPERGENSPLQLLAEDCHLYNTVQYRLSNILIEQDGHPGIFRKENDKYIPTEYANSLLEFTLFNGAINQDTDIAVLYSNMSKGDYIGTSWANFFSDVNSNIQGQNIKLGRYFLRIPSDAPKTFIIKAPRYIIDATTPLFSTGNQEEFDSFIKNIANNLLSSNVTVPVESLLAYAEKVGVLVENDNDFVKHIFSKGERGIDLGEFLSDREILNIQEEVKAQNEDTAKILFVKKNNDKTVFSYIMEGNLKKGYLYNAKFKQFINAENSKDSLTDIISNYFESDFINKGKITYNGTELKRERVINKNHQIFKQLKSSFKQELLDGIDAARLMFKTSILKDGEGNPILVNGKESYIINRDENLNPILKEQWAKDLNGLSPIYHFKNNKAYENNKLTGRVFESDRFIIFDENKEVVRNYGQELINSVVQYLSTTENPSIDNLLLWSENNGTFDLNLTQTQENIIDNAISNYINDFVDASYARIQKTKHFMRGKKININSVADYVLNHQLMYIASNELLEGDTKYYKNVQTFLKRTKEYQASGTPYGISSIRRTLSTPPLESIQIGPANWNVKLTDRFNAVTFHTTNTFNEKVLNSLESVLSNKDIMGDHAMSEPEAHALMYGIDGNGGYTDAKVNDAQSYIIFDEWIRRVAARGELDKYTPLINKIKNKEIITKDELTEFIQIQKNVYYDLYYDPITNRRLPRQIKNAEFVLVPNFIEGTELYEVYKFMVNNNIAQLNTDETSKAANNYIIDVFDKKGNLSQTIIDLNNLSELENKENKTKEEENRLKRAKDYKNLVTKAIQPYSYNYLYEQQKVPQHIFSDNKLAIQIAKKIIDNIQENHPLYDKKIEYFNLLTTNIKDSFKNLMKEFNIPVDENGNLLATDVTIFEKIDYKKFYDKLKIELGRLGFDDNSFDYATLTGNILSPGETVMPNYVGMMINKLESIVQSIVTKAITRQTLHGFHAAQITNVGYKKLGDKNTIKKDSNLKYHPVITDKQGNKKVEAYIEVKLPYAAFGIDKNSSYYKNMSDEDIIKELEKEGLDKFIGYRIPTEGKQSIAIMKIAGFIPDGSGSTIVVPNEWVPQTGSDFDVDSVYGIMHKVYINKRNGRVTNIKYKTNFNITDWFNYVSKNIGKKEIKLAIKDYRNKLQEIEKEAYKNLPGKYFIDKNTKKYVYIGPKGAVVKIHGAIAEAYGDEHSKQRYSDQLLNEIEYLTKLLDTTKFNEEEIKNIQIYVAVIEKIYDDLNGDVMLDGSLYKNENNKDLNEYIDKIEKAQFDFYFILSKHENIMSKDDFITGANSNPINYNTKTARDNRLVDIMIEIMSHPYSLEENLSRSNFDKITGNKNAAVDKLRNKIEELKRKNRSPYNILDEAEFQEDAMQGFALKGFSVSRDTFCSICNTVRPFIHNTYAVTIDYDYSYLNDEEFNKVLKILKTRFDDNNQENVKNTGKIIHIRHNKIGWSSDDRNINGEYITVYSSQTTAHILDAMKSGPVPNVNKYTFGVYKTLVDLGSRYETAVGFIMHPAVAVINEYYNRTNSIYANDVSTKYIESALEEYCDRLEIAVNKENIKNIVNNTKESIISIPMWTRESAEKDTNTLYIFTDNTDRTSGSKVIDSNSPYAKKYGKGKHYPTQTQAVIRGLPNAMPISTQHWYHEGAKGKTGRWTDDYIEEFKKVITNEIEDIKKEWLSGKYSKIAFGGRDGLFNGAISEITKDRTPKIYDFLQLKYNELLEFIKNNPSDNKIDTNTKFKFNKRMSFNEKLQVINQFFGVNISTNYMANKLRNIDENDLALRITNEEAYKEKVGGEVNMILADMHHILHFAKLMELTNNINSIQQVTNPDKFGAKQTIFETEKVFENIENYIKSQYTYSIGGKYVNNSVLSVNGKDILEAIYPDFIQDINKFENTFDENIEFFVKSSDNVKRSLYPSLCAHLKYGSATSIVVNKAFFATQTPIFRELIYSIEDLFSDNKSLDEKTYKELRSYIINALYRRTGFINSDLAYNKTKKAFVFNNTDMRENNYAEYSRIFGYTRSIGFEVPVYNSKENDVELKPVKINNISNPTQGEINLFAALSPAQKIEFVKKHFEGESIFNYLNTRLYTTYSTKNTSPGAQLISFVESSADIDYLRDLFYKAFTNKNPLVALTAADIIKYAFVVDGYQFSRNGVSKLIPNSLLLNDGPYAGTNIIPETNNLVSRINEIISEDDLENFIRSHSNLYQINTRRVKKHGNMYELAQNNEDVIIINYESKDLLEKYGIKKSNKNSYNSYVRLKFGKNTILYKIYVIDDGSVILTPLNNLERNENANQSANETFNIYPVKQGGYDYFEDVIVKYLNSRPEGTTGISTYMFDKLIEETNPDAFKAVTSVILDGSSVKEFDVKADTPLGRILIKNATEIVNDKDKAYRFFYNLSIDKYMIDDKPIYVSIPIETVKNGKVEYSNARTIFEISPVDISYLYKYFVSPSLDRKGLSKHDLDILDSLEKTMKTRSISKNFSHMFEIKEFKKNLNNKEVKKVKFSTIGHKVKPIVSATMSVIDGINYMGIVTGEERSAALSRDFKQQGIFKKEKVAETHVEDIIIPASKVIVDAVQNIKDRFNQFWEIPGKPNNYYKITDPEVIKEIKINDSLREKYLKAIMDPSAIESKFAIFRDLDIQSEDENLRPYLEKIKNSVAELRTIPEVKKAQENYVYEVLDALSDNPDIKGGLTNIIGGFYKQSTLNALFNDIQESPNSVVQVTMKMVQSKLRATEMQTETDIKNFTNHVEDIKARASAAGQTINYDNIFDEYGRYRRLYKQKLISDRKRLQKAQDDAKTHWIQIRDSKPNNDLSIESIQAYLYFKNKELEYNEWKAKYVEQPAYNKHNTKMGIEDNGYYNTKNELERAMLNSRAKYIYAIYNILRNKKARLIESQMEDIDNPALDEEIENINLKLYKLTQTNIYDSIIRKSIKKPETPNSDNVAEMIKNSWFSYTDSKLLNDYLFLYKGNENKYFKYEEKPEFKQKVKDNLAIKEKYEDRDENGEPRVSQDILANNKEYKKAKLWLRRNASSIFIETEDSDWIYEYRKAISILHENVEDISSEYNDIYYRSKHRDENGDLDGIEISKDEDLVRKIKKAQQINYNVFREGDISDRKLLSLAPKDDLVYTDLYWDELLGAKIEDNNMREDYANIITSINNILSPYYTESTNSIDWVKMFNDNTEEETINILTALNLLYDKLDNTRKNIKNSKSKKDIAKWIEDNCVTVMNTSRYSDDMITASMYKGKVQTLFKQLIKGHNKDNTEGNSYLYKTFKLKYEEGSEEYNKYVDTAKTNARRIINEYTYKVPTKYYNIARREASKKGKDFYKKWFLDNHVYNPYERKFEPLAFWITTKFRTQTNSNIIEDWKPKYGQTKRVVRDGYYTISDIYTIETISNEKSITIPSKILDNIEYDMIGTYNEDKDLRNNDYKEGFGHGENYIYGSNPEYDNPNPMNEFEQELSDYMQLVTDKLVQDEQSQHYIKRGWAPTRAINETTIGKELKKLAGFATYNSGRDDETPIIDYAHDKYIPTPMLTFNRNVSIPNNLKRPIREECISEEEYLRKKRAWDEEEERVKEEELELRKLYHDKDYEGVFKEFIKKANKHNTIQHAKMDFYIAQKLLSEYGVYRQRYGKEGNFKKDGTISDSDQSEYLKQIDEDMVSQFNTTIRRFVNNEWKSPEGSLTRYMSMLQAMTSAKFMILNHKGAVANVTYGEASIYSEAAAGEYFNKKEYLKGARLYSSGILDYISHMYSDKSSTLAGAITKYMHIIDNNENIGLNYIQDDLAEISKKLNDFAYSAHRAGEHEMQNRTLFSMMESHRLFLNPRHSEFGQPKYKYMNFKEYIEGLEESALIELLSEEELKEYENYKERIKSDANKLKSYIWQRDNFVTNYVQAKFSYARQSEFNRLKNNRLKDKERQFYDDVAHPTILSQLKLGNDGKLAFRENSLLAELDKMIKGKEVTEKELTERNNEFNSPSDAVKFLADFKGRVISVNKKIHGSYDKSGRAKVENTWYGSIIAQFHKHLPIGFSKRYRSKGYFNEERGSREKGAYISILDFLSIPVKRHQTLLELTDKEVEATIGVQNIIKEYLNFALHLKVAYNTMSEFEKANVRRANSDFKAMFSALFACIALKMAATDDDKNLWWYNFAFYQTDRLATEASQYMPWVLPQEVKRFFGNPIAGFKEVDDVLNTISGMTQMLMGTIGLSDFNPVYDSGINSGRHKLVVYIERNIPFWRGIRSAYIDINENNKAYKAGKNVLGFIDSDIISEKLKDVFD
jgi:hypothetical protein